MSNLDRVIDAMFALDIVTNFRTIYIDARSEQVVSDSKKICWNYLKGRFIIDLLASIPFDSLASISAYFARDGQVIDSSTSEFLSMLKLTRLLRLGRMISYI